MKITVELDAYEFATVVDILVNKNVEDYTYKDDDTDDTDDTPDEKSDNTESLKAIIDIAKIIADKITKSSNAE